MVCYYVHFNPIYIICIVHIHHMWNIHSVIPLMTTLHWANESMFSCEPPTTEHLLGFPCCQNYVPVADISRTDLTYITAGCSRSPAVETKGLKRWRPHSSLCELLSATFLLWGTNQRARRSLWHGFYWSVHLPDNNYYYYHDRVELSMVRQRVASGFGEGFGTNDDDVRFITG